MFEYLRPLTKLLMKDYYLDRRSAARFSTIIRNLDELEKIENNIEILANRKKSKKSKVEKLVNDHKKVIIKTIPLIKQVISNENLSYENDIKAPQDAIIGFVGLLEEHFKDLVDPALKKAVAQSVKKINDAYQDLEQELEKEITAVTEAYSREIMGTTSAYAHATGNIHELAEIVGSSVARKQEIDNHVQKIVKEVKSITKHVTEYLNDKKKKTSIDLDKIFKKKAVVGVWYRLGDKEFRQRLYKYKTYQIHRWVVRDAGKKGSGVFANKSILASIGIFHHEFLQLCSSFEKNYFNLIEQIWGRSQLTKHILSNCGFIVYQIEQRIVALEKKVEHWLAGDKKAVAKVIAIEKEEERTVKAALQGFVTYGMRSLAFVKLSNKTVSVNLKRAITTLLIAGFALNPINHNAGALPSASAHGVNAPAMVSQITSSGEKERVVAVPVEIEVRDVVESNIIERVGMNVVEVAQFPKGVSDEVINQAQDIDHFTPNILSAVQNAARDAGYTNYGDFIKDSDLTINFKMTGNASIEGKGSYNLKLSKARADHVKQKLQKLTEQGIKVNFKIVEGKGEQSEVAFVKSIKNMLKKKSTGDYIVNDLMNKLNPKSKRALDYWWAQYNNPKGKSLKRNAKIKKKALANLEWVISRTAELDALLLAPERKVEVLAELEYNKTITTEKESIGGMCMTQLVTVDDDSPIITPLDIQPEKRGFIDKCVLTTGPQLRGSRSSNKSSGYVPNIKGTKTRTTGRKKLGRTWGHRVTG